MADVMSLSTELHTMIVDHLDYFSMANLRCTNRYFHDLPQEDQLSEAFHEIVEKAETAATSPGAFEKWPMKKGMTGEQEGVEIQTPFRYMAPCFECEDLKNISEICTDRDDTRRSTQWGWNNLKGCGIGSCIDCKTEELTAEWQEHGSGWVKTLSGDTFIVCRECKTFKWDDSIEVCHVKLRQSKLCFECWDDKYKDWIEFGETLDAKWNLLHEKIAKMEVEIWEEMRNEEGRPVDKVAEPSWGDNEFDPINETPEFGIRYHARVETATSELSAKLSEYGKTRKWMENHVQGTATTDRPKDLEGIEIP